MTAVVCEGLELRAGFKTLIRNFSLSVARGEARAVIGPNGLGKTTLLRTLCGVSKPFKGKVQLSGRSVWPVTEDVMAGNSVCYLASQPALFLDHTVIANLQFYVRSHHCEWQQDAAISALRSVGLDDRLQQTARTLSTGQKRRLTLSFLQMVKPEILLLDEPTNGLDADGVELCLRSLAEMRDMCKSALLIATHDPQLIQWCGQSIDLKRWAP